MAFWWSLLWLACGCHLLARLSSWPFHSLVCIVWRRWLWMNGDTDGWPMVLLRLSWFFWLPTCSVVCLNAFQWNCHRVPTRQQARDLAWPNFKWGRRRSWRQFVACHLCVLTWDFGAFVHTQRLSALLDHQHTQQTGQLKLSEGFVSTWADYFTASAEDTPNQMCFFFIIFIKYFLFDFIV